MSEYTDKVGKADFVLYLAETNTRVCSTMEKLKKVGTEDSELFKKLEEASDAIEAFGFD